MKKILIISNVPFYGGGEQFVYSTLVHLEEFYDVFYLVADSTLYEKLKDKQVFRFSSSCLWQQYIEVKRIAKKNSIDLLLYNGGSAFYFSPILRQYRQVLYRHSTDKCVPMRRRLFYKLLMNLVYQIVDLTIHVSKYSLNQQILKKNAIYIHNGVFVSTEKTIRQIPSSILKVLYCGRLEHSKGIDIVVDAFRNIPVEVAELYIVGDGSLKDSICQKLRENIRYFGFRKDVGAFYKDVDALILMSDNENCPMSILEAMNKSLPIITTGVGGISEMVVSGFNGIIISRNRKAIEEAVMMFAKSRELVAKMGENSRKFCEKNFDIIEKVKEIHTAIETVFQK